MLSFEEFFAGKEKPRQEFNPTRIVHLRPKNFKSEPKINPKFIMLDPFIQELKSIKMEVLVKNYRTNPFFKVKADFLITEL